MTKLELLSPARTADIGIEAIRHGADAVYIGAPRFGARAAAGNSVEDIGRLVQYAHLFHAKVYVTVNTLLRDDELRDVEKLIWQLYDIGVDALIVQDLRLLTLDLPPIALHASTQMDNRTPEKVKWLYDRGFRQVVLARELTIEQIRDIHRACPDMKIECFVHGALCVSLSGRCYASECLFGRSANRGECAQVCRMEFDLIEETKGDDGRTQEHTLMKNKHLMSLKDLCLLGHLNELADAGVTSFKIEGRLKDMAYVKNVTAAYSVELNQIVRSHPDAYMRASHGEVELSFTPDVHKSFNRGFTTYFLHGRTPDIFSFDTPKAIGECVGTVKEVFTTCFTVAGIHRFANGDGLCFFDRKGRLHGFRLNKVTDGRLFPLDMPRELQPKMRLYRNFDKQFDDTLQGESAVRTIPVDITLGEAADGFRLVMTDDYGYEAVVCAPCEKQLARTHQRDNIALQLSRLGGTVYKLRSLNLDFDKNWFIPASRLSQWRREAVAEMEMSRQEPHTSPLQTLSPTLPLYGEGGRWKTSRMVLPPSLPRDDGGEMSEGQRGSALMTCRHCIKYSLGKCRQPMGALSLLMANGTRFRLHFDCRACMMHVLRLLILLPLFCACSSEAESVPSVDLQPADTLLLLTQAQADSLNFRLAHHYTNNFNFMVKADTLLLMPSVPGLQPSIEGFEADTVAVVRGNVIAVADIRVMPDTVWVKVARDQFTMGWISEPRLLSGTTPDDTISIIIDRLQQGRVLWMSVLSVFSLLLFIRRTDRRRRGSAFDPLYPCLLIMLTAVMSCLYTSIQMWVPEFWQEYYFHPTLNPLHLPPAMSALVVLVWLIVVVAVAFLLEVYKYLDFTGGIRTILLTCGLSMLSYLIVAYTTRIYVGYLLLPLLLAVLTWNVCKANTRQTLPPP